MVCADSGPVVTVASDLIGENPDPQHDIIPGFKCCFRGDVQVFEPPVVDLHEANVMREATSASLADDGQSAGAGAGRYVFPAMLTHQGSRPDSVFAMARTSRLGTR